MEARRRGSKKAQNTNRSLIAIYTNMTAGVENRQRMIDRDDRRGSNNLS